jgi:hypothetical protein
MTVSVSWIFFFAVSEEAHFYPFLKPKISPGINPMPAAKGNPEAAIEECVANCDAVLLSACTTCPTTLVNVSSSSCFFYFHPFYVYPSLV